MHHSYRPYIAAPLVGVLLLAGCDSVSEPQDEISGEYAAKTVGGGPLPTVIGGGGVTLIADSLTLRSWGTFEERITAVGFEGTTEVRLRGHWDVRNEVVRLESDDGRYEHELVLDRSGALTTRSRRLDPGSGLLLIFVFERTS